MLKVIKAAPYIQIIKINKVAFKRKIIIKKKKKNVQTPPQVYSPI